MITIDKWEERKKFSVMPQAKILLGTRASKIVVLKLPYLSHFFLENINVDVEIARLENVAELIYLR